MKKRAALPQCSWEEARLLLLIEEGQPPRSSVWQQPRSGQRAAVNIDA